MWNTIHVRVSRAADDRERAAEVAAYADGGDGADAVLPVCGGAARPPALHGRPPQQVCPRRPPTT